MSTDAEDFRIIEAWVATPETDPLLTFTPGRIMLIYRLNHTTTVVWSRLFRDEVTKELIALTPYTTHWAWQILPFRDLISFNITAGSGTMSFVEQLVVPLERALIVANENYRRHIQEEHGSAKYIQEEAWGDGLRRNEHDLITLAKSVNALLAQQFPRSSH